MTGSRIVRKAGALAGVVAAGSLLAGCQTFSFAPPPVNLSTAAVVEKCPGAAKAAVALDARTIDGAARLIDNFVLAYRCAQVQATDGRRIFEVPSFLALATAAMAGPLGIGDNSATIIAGGAAVAGGANRYFAPKEKAGILNAALDALLCIKMESVGAHYFDRTAQLPGADGGGAKGLWRALGIDAPASVSVPAERQYFEMVLAALLTVERVLATRLSDSGKYDAAGVTDELKKLFKQEEVAAGETRAAGEEVKNAGKNLDAQLLSNLDTDAGRAKAALALQLLQQREKRFVTIQLDELQAKLQQCVVRAKMA
ncbi:hypothetical protein ACFQ1E_07750 [Sphingomonas canadensis]|uniref:Imelysin-like domain-containing protein n=1 Tax=Sphingomonas canadensis TaxID=1219257 RepID=A0ABW3HAA5_9SPHN|nr:hypothetical protein [Sphingomonas canadensis]MCW3835929.1 hypothetical protein [Sphingomonas canadensis]